MNIEQELVNWDGKSARDIDGIYQRHCDDISFAATLIGFLQQTNLQKGATWLLKRYFDSGQQLAANEIALIYRCLPQLEHWETKLHILQCIPFMPIAQTEKKYVEMFLRQSLTDSNKFIRAWAYNGFYEISMQYPEYKKETKQFFEMAMHDEVPSVKARIRNIVKNGF